MQHLSRMSPELQMISEPANCVSSREDFLIKHNRRNLRLNTFFYNATI